MPACRRAGLIPDWLLVACLETILGMSEYKTNRSDFIIQNLYKYTTPYKTVPKSVSSVSDREHAITFQVVSFNSNFYITVQQIP